MYRNSINWNNCFQIKSLYVLSQELVKLVNLLGGFNQAETSFLRQIMNLQLQVALQLLHQFEGLHILLYLGFKSPKHLEKGIKKNKMGKFRSPRAVGQGLPSPLRSAEPRCRVSLVNAFLQEIQTNNPTSEMWNKCGNVLFKALWLE